MKTSMGFSMMGLILASPRMHEVTALVLSVIVIAAMFIFMSRGD